MVFSFICSYLQNFFVVFFLSFSFILSSGASARDRPQSYPLHSHTTPGRERARAKMGGKGQRGTLRQGGTEAPKVTGRRPEGHGTGSDKTWEQETTEGPGRGGNRDRGAEKGDITAGTRTHTQEGHSTTEGPASPHPKRTPHDPRGRRPPTHAAEARIGRHTDHTGTRPPATGNHTADGGHTCTGGTGYTHRGSHRKHRRTAHQQALTARRRPRPPQGPPHKHRKGKKARPQHPGLGTGTPRGHGTTAQAPREGSPTDTHPTHQPKQHTQTPTARTQRATHT